MQCTCNSGSIIFGVILALLAIGAQLQEHGTIVQPYLITTLLLLPWTLQALVLKAMLIWKEYLTRVTGEHKRFDEDNAIMVLV